jgi:hypothetical protein
MHRGFCYCAALVALIAAPALADPGDPPARVARLNYLYGSVSFRPGTIEDWTEASLNFPLTTGDHLWTDQASQTELHVGSTALRMGQTTALAVLNLDDRTVQLSLTEGTLNVHVRDLDPDEVYEIDTPNAAIALLRPGNYRIDTFSDRNITYVTVWDGEADVTGSGNTFPLRFGQRAQITGDGPDSQQIDAAPQPADFDRWCEARDRREEQSQSARYVSREMTGYEDLDEYGAWQSMPNYGSVWIPAGMPVGWAPYHYGRWAWVDPWGWTWIDEAPWGFAPYHYGRWAYSRPVGWFWVPGPIAPRPVYAPALVAFVGGPRMGIEVGWFPLGPGEIYRPGYRMSDRYASRVNMTQVNVTNINITNVRYVNREAPGAVAMVRREDFVQARPVRTVARPVDMRTIGGAEVVGMTAPVAPTRVSVLARPDGRRIAPPPERYVARPVVARTAPPAAPVSFRARERALQANQGRPLDSSEVENLRRAAPAAAPAVRTLPPPQGGFRRAVPVNTPARPAEQPRQEQPGRPVAEPGRQMPPNSMEQRPFPVPAQRPQAAPAPQPQDRPGRPAPIAQPDRQISPRPSEPRTFPSQPERPQAAPAPQPRQDRPANPAPTAQPDRPMPPRPMEQRRVPAPAERPQAAPAPQPRQERSVQPRSDRPAQAAPRNRPEPKKGEDKENR